MKNYGELHNPTHNAARTSAVFQQPGIQLAWCVYYLSCPTPEPVAYLESLILKATHRKYQAPIQDQIN